MESDESMHKHFVQVVLYYEKAFDNVNPSILLQNVQSLDIPDPLLGLVEAFLMDMH